MPLFADGDFTGLIGYVVAGFVAMGGAIAYMYRTVVAKMEDALKDMKAENVDLKSKVKSLESVSDEARETALQVANWYRKKYEDKPPIIPLVGVVPEANSPSTEKQRIESRIATLRAGMAEIKKAVGLPPRETPEQAVEPDGKTGLIQEPPKKHDMSVVEALGVKEEIGKIPEKTAAKVVEKLKDNDPPLPMH